MKILLVHNSYMLAGGEDSVFRNERELLQSRGHQVFSYHEHNNKIPGMNLVEVAALSIWNWQTYRAVRKLISEHGIEVVHVHNYFPLISPSVFAAAKKENVALVHTLHNFRLACVNGMLFRDGRACYDCITAKSLLPGVMHRCYRSSYMASMAVALTVSLHNAMRTLLESVDLFIAVNDTVKRKLTEVGLPESRIRVKKQCLPSDPGTGNGAGSYATFIGRLSPEKGISELLSAWKKLSDPSIKLKIAGDGPMKKEVEEAARANQSIEYLGWLEEADLHSLLANAKFAMLPSTYHEVGPIAFIQAIARGTPVIGSRIGSIETSIQNDVNGYLFEAGDSDDLARAVQVAFACSQEKLDAMRKAARNQFLTEHSPEVSYSALLDVYQEAMGMHSQPNTR